MAVNKDRIQQRFARAAATYDRQAFIQLKMARRLLGLLDEHLSSPPRRLLEIGCCTGLLTEQLVRCFPAAETFFVNDLVPAFEETVRRRTGGAPQVRFLPGDIERIDIPADLDLVVSSSTLHWLADLPGFLRRLATRLPAGATFCFSIYGPENLAEVREITSIGLDYRGSGDLRRLVGERFDLLALEEEKAVLFFDDPLALLNHLRETGVNALDAPPWTRSRLEYFRQEYMARFSVGDRVFLTYHPVYCVARRR
ncbi:MAG: malonyl-ACP O-methyltransferase BioC [Desulfobulbaceae bacterium]